MKTLTLNDPEVVRLLEELAEKLVDPSSDYTGEVNVSFHYRQGVAGAAHLGTKSATKLFGHEIATTKK